MKQIKVLAFDTGGTVLDWHAGLTAAMAAWGTAHGIERDWHALANEHRRRTLRRMTGLIDPAFNIDDVHRGVLANCSTRTGSAALRKTGGRSRSAGIGSMRGRILLWRCADCGGTAYASRSRSSACR